MIAKWSVTRLTHSRRRSRLASTRLGLQHLFRPSCAQSVFLGTAAAQAHLTKLVCSTAAAFIRPAASGAACASAAQQFCQQGAGSGHSTMPDVWQASFGPRQPRHTSAAPDAGQLLSAAGCEGITGEIGRQQQVLYFGSGNCHASVFRAFCRPVQLCRRGPLPARQSMKSAIDTLTRGASLRAWQAVALLASRPVHRFQVIPGPAAHLCSGAAGSRRR